MEPESKGGAARSRSREEQRDVAVSDVAGVSRPFNPSLYHDF
jgi:hypothetical protein